MISPLQALLLGILEGLTEYLPVSSTGHLILASHWLGLEGEAVKTFEVVIQAGALGAVLALYRDRVAAMARGLAGRDAAGRALAVNLAVSFLPAAAAGLLLHRAIKAHLFTGRAVVAALALGGVMMLVVDRRLRARGRAPGRSVESITVGEALLIGAAQCLSLWPGISRAMVTLIAGMLVGLPATAAAEYSFLLALPTLGMATVFDAATGGAALLRDVGALSLALGFSAAAVVAALAIRGFVRYLTRRGLAPFGWYRLALAAAVWLTEMR
jgi:undecaprenyl-diphosphatase